MSAPCRRVPPNVRCNLVVALGDLASRWPNALEPWTWCALIRLMGYG